jgi:hypothetical protein
VETTRKVWFCRNAWVHEGIFSHPNDIVLAATASIENFYAAQRKEEESRPLEEPNVKMWRKLEASWLKVNCDVALDHQGGCVGIGIVVWDEEGHVCVARRLTRNGFLKPKLAEVVATFYGHLFVSFCIFNIFF